MCGIVGVVQFTGGVRPLAQRVAEIEASLALISHRGPDQAGFVMDEHVAFGTARLSVVDLAGGTQPMSEETGRFWITYNGEVYNFLELRTELATLGHRFRTTSDTEIVLRAWIEWGVAAPERFDGGFAFAVWDRAERRVWLVRDRYGKRPLYYAEHGPALLFASEIKGLLGRPDMALEWDPGGLAAVFAKWAPFETETPYRGVRQLAPGGVLEIGPAGSMLRRFAGFPVPADDPPNGITTPTAAAGALRDALDASVRRRLRADVEVAVLLSGGLDSAIIAHLAQQARPGGIRAFSLTFAIDEFDERADQALVARHLGLERVAVEVGPGAIAEDFTTALWHAEIPQFRTAFVPMLRLADAIAAAGVKVVLSGEGADEVCLGYDIFRETRLRAAWPGMAPVDRQNAIRALYPYLPFFAQAPAAAIETMLGRTVGTPEDPLFSHRLRLDHGRFALRLLHQPDGGLDAIAAAMGERGMAAAAPVRRAQWLEWHTLLQGYLLSSQGDRMMFARGVEPRNPFLSPPIVELAARLPEAWHLPASGEEKALLKRAFSDSLPERILRRPKQPYRAPSAAAFRRADGQGLLPWVADALEPASLAQIAPLNGAACAGLVERIARAEPAQISPREDQAFLLLLSTSVLDRLMIGRAGVAAPRRSPPVRQVVLSRAA